MPAPRSVAPCGVWMPSARSRVRLTERQYALARLVADGLTNREIAAEVGIAEQTVRHTLVRVFAMCGVPNRTALARLWLTGGLAARPVTSTRPGTRTRRTFARAR